MKVNRSTAFKKDYKLAKRQQKDLKTLTDAIQKLVRKEKLPARLRDHKLSGSLKKYRELHLKPDWLLIYRIDKKNNELKLARLGSHSELYE